MNKKRDWEGIEFDEMFGECESNDRNLTDEPYMKLVYLDERTVVPCKECGRYPRLHVANFINRAAHPNNIYMSCPCGNCDGNWYPDRESAIEAWNVENAGSQPKDPEKKDMYDHLAYVLEDLKRGE